MIFPSVQLDSFPIFLSRVNSWQLAIRLKILIIENCSVVSDSLWPHGLYSPWNSPGQNAGMGSLSLLQGIFPTQWFKPGLLHCRQILYQLEPKGRPRNTGMGSLSLLQGNLPNLGIEPRSPALQAYSLPAKPPGKPKQYSWSHPSPRFPCSLVKARDPHWPISCASHE